MSLELFHPVIARWFEEKFGAPTEPQRLAWPAIARGENTLIAAPTGSGKTLSAFLVCIDRLVKEAIEGDLENECRVLYISPLKALASDIRKNLEVPLAEIQQRVFKKGLAITEIRSQVRTGDTPAHQRQQITKKPPHILVTTPESLYLMLTSEKGRAALRTVETIIVDEIHALARDKRGSHLSLSLERLKALLKKPATMIGLSATQKPVNEIAAFLVGVDPANQERLARPCAIFDIGHTRTLDLGFILPQGPLSTLASNEQWEEIYQLIANEIRQHRSTLLFVNTRRLSERVAFRLTEILGEDEVLCHHGSLSKERRLKAETLLKEGKLKAIVATASLELGIDIGYIDLVCQIGVPFSIATFLQRIGRSGHAIRATPKGRMVPLTRDELLESLALLKAVREKKLDRIEIPMAPLDILAQQVIAELAGRGPEGFLTVREAYDLFTRAWPYRNLPRERFIEVLRVAAEGYAPGKRKFAYLMWDRLRDRLSVRAGARIAATTSGGSIPEMGEYRVVLEDDGTMLGTVNEDFAIESLAGDIFVLGTHSWRVRHVRGAEVVVQDAHGQPPSVPFWLGEAPGRTKEFSAVVSDLRREIGERILSAELSDSQLVSLESVAQLRELTPPPFLNATRWLGDVSGVSDSWALLQAAHYIAVQKAALGLVPWQEQIVFERFFDEVGGMQLVIHSPYGARMNRAWGLALRKRFCRQFDFELQASADDDGIVLSLGPQQSFPLESLFKMLNEENVEPLLIQAILAAPMFGVRWRWNITRALAVLRQMGGKRIAPALQRFRSEDLLTAVFPAQTACQENVVGDIEVPDHPLVQQTVRDCLTEAMDIESLKSLFARISKGEVELIAKDTREPSPFAYQLLNAYPYAFLDDAAAEDRRTRSVAMRPALSLQELQELDRMDPKAIRQVSAEVWPHPKSADEFYEVLVATPAFPVSRASEYQPLIDELMEQGRVALGKGQREGLAYEFVVAAESIPLVEAGYEGVAWSRRISLPTELIKSPAKEEALQSVVKGWLDIRGPVTVEEISQLFAMAEPDLHLSAIESTGSILRCKLDKEQAGYSHWCSRGLLRRIHRLTVEGLREQIRPVSPEDYLEFIFEEHGLSLHEGAPVYRDSDGLIEIVEKLQGFEAPALAWESELFAGRMENYQASELDQLTGSGAVMFGRITPKKKNAASPTRTLGVTSSMPLSFVLRRDWPWISASAEISASPQSSLGSNAGQVLEALTQSGAQFIDELVSRTKLLETQVEASLGELASEGLVTCDHFNALRSILSPLKKEKERALGSLARRLGKTKLNPASGGRWSLLKKPFSEPVHVEEWAAQLLARYGIVFRDLLERETLAPSWGDLVRVFRRLEARGEIRGGRFITGVSGEQFGLPETHERLIQIRAERQTGKRKNSFTIISSADPLNLVGIVTKGDRITSSASTRLLFEAGELTAIGRGYDVESLRPVAPDRVRTLRLIGTFRRRGDKGLRGPLSRGRQLVTPADAAHLGG